MKYQLRNLAAASAVCLLAANSMAATNPATPTTVSSTGDLTITAGIQDLVRVSQLTDIALGNYVPGADLVGNSPVCIYRNGTGNYAITFTGSGTASAFTLLDTLNTPYELPYTVNYNDAAGNAGEVAVTSGTQLTGQTGGDGTDIDCANTGVNGNIEVTIAEADLQAAPVDTYSGVLTVVIVPEP